MGELLDFTKKNLIPPYEDLTFEVLRNLLVKIVNTIYHQTNVQNQLLSGFDEEFKIRPTYSEIINFISKRSDPEDSKKTYVALDSINNVINEFERKIDLSANTTKDTIHDFKQNFSFFRDSAMENFRKLSTQLSKHSEERKNVIKFVRNLKIIQGQKKRIYGVFTRWKKVAHKKKKFKKLMRKIIKKKEVDMVAKAWNRVKGAYLLMRMKKNEGNTIKALFMADECQGKLLAVLPEIVEIKKSKADNEDLLKIAGVVQRINYESVFKDLAGMIKDDTNKLNDDLKIIQKGLISKLKDFEKQIQVAEKQIQDIEILIKEGGGTKEIFQVKGQIGSLTNSYLLLSEKVARIDFWNKKEDCEFKVEMISKQIQQLENKIISITSSQDGLQDQALYIKTMLNAPNNKSAVKMLSSTGRKSLDQKTNEIDLNVSGFYIKPNKRVASASPKKQRVYSMRHKRNIPTSFSSAFSHNESPILWANKGT